jgi:hypothetical protein
MAEENRRTAVLFAREPLLKPVAIQKLRPTQITVGMREVSVMRARWRARSEKKDLKFLEHHIVPVVLGPKHDHFVIDHHHLCLALHQEGVKDVFVTVAADLARLEKNAFWVFLDNRAWMHPFDDEGRRCAYSDIPRTLEQLVDDPFRSLAGELRRAGGFAKDTAPFSEFLWADFLRRRIKRKRVERDFEGALKKASALAKSKDADYLPGWCGPD